jgi:acetyl esterase/lipase
MTTSMSGHVSQNHVAAVHIERGVPFGEVNGRTLLMDIARPAAQRTDVLPAVIDIHGGGWAEGERCVNSDSILPNNGFLYCSIDYRLSGEAPFPAQIHDCKAGTLIRHGG